MQDDINLIKENVNENVEKNVLANYYKKEKVSVMFFLKSDIAKVNVERLKKQRTMLL